MKRLTKIEKVEKIHKLGEKIDRAEEQTEVIFKKKVKNPFRIEVQVGNDSFPAWGIQPRDFSEQTQIRLQKYYTRLVKYEINSMKSERDRLLRLLR